jgi:hypothetical protein
MATPLLVEEITFSQLRGTSSRSLTSREAERYFIVRYAADDLPASFAEVETANDGSKAIPTLRVDTLPGDSTRYVSNITPKVIGPDGSLFEVKVSYDDAIIVFENPLDEPDDIVWGASDGTATFFVDKSDPPKPVVNTAGQPFEQFQERDDGELVVTINRNVADFDPAVSLAFKHTLNDDVITIDGQTIAARKAKIGIITAGGKQKRNGTTFRVMTIPIKLRANWDITLDNYGFSQLVSGKPLPIVDAAKQPVTKPWPLNADGTKKTNSTDTPATSTFVKYDDTDFSSLSLT